MPVPHLQVTSFRLALLESMRNRVKGNPYFDVLYQQAQGYDKVALELLEKRAAAVHINPKSWVDPQSLIKALMKVDGEDFFLFLMNEELKPGGATKVDLALMQKRLLMVSKANGKTSRDNRPSFEEVTTSPDNILSGYVIFNGEKEKVEVKLPEWGASAGRLEQQVTVAPKTSATKQAVKPAEPPDVVLSLDELGSGDEGEGVVDIDDFRLDDSEEDSDSSSGSTSRTIIPEYSPPSVTPTPPTPQKGGQRRWFNSKRYDGKDEEEDAKRRNTERRQRYKR